MTRLARWLSGVARWLRLLASGSTLAFSFVVAFAVAEEPLVFADPPLTLDPASCRPAAAATYLALGSEAVVVVGHDDEGRCRIERFSEGEGAYTQLLCFVAADVPPERWDPRGRGIPGAFAYEDACEVIATGNLLLPEGEEGRPPFPLGDASPEPAETP